MISSTVPTVSPVQQTWIWFDTQIVSSHHCTCCHCTGDIIVLPYKAGIPALERRYFYHLIPNEGPWWKGSLCAGMIRLNLMRCMTPFRLCKFYTLYSSLRGSGWDRGGRFKNTYELLNLRALKISKLHKNHIFQCMGKIFCVEFQRVPLKFHIKYLTHTLKDVDFIHIWKFKSS